MITAELVRQTGRYGSVLVLVPRGEILWQTSRKLAAAGVEHGIIAAGVTNPAPAAGVQLAMVWTLANRALPFWPRLVVIDEAHLARAATYSKILARWKSGPLPPPWLLLLTATPWRTDGQGFTDLATELVVVATVAELVELGHLVRPVIYSAAAPDLAGVPIRGGDFAQAELAARYERPAIVGDTIAAYFRHAAGRPTAVFASSVEHSRQLVERFLAAGVRAVHVDGNTPPAERARILGDGGDNPGVLATGEADVICNYGIATEGWDCPAVAAVVMARATASKALAFQIPGRGLRPAPGKVDCVVVDQGLNWQRHGLIHAPQDYSLEGRAKRDRGDVLALRTCDDCFAVFPSGPVCPRCGMVAEPSPRRGPDEKTGVQLVEITAELAAKAKRDPNAPLPRPADVPVATWRAVEADRRAKGYKPAWSYVQARLRVKASSWGKAAAGG